MKRISTVFFTLLIHLLTLSPLKATHIVGAELTYECISPADRQYRLTLIMYRDCLAGQAAYDDVITIFVFSAATGQVVQHINVPRPPTTPRIQPENLDACVASTPPICVEEGVYETVVQLPDITGGYHIAWARCCRNAAIDNLANPLGEGITFLASLPDPRDALCNSMPRFDQTPPIFLCANEPFFFDHSATDPDGDSLSYAITNPYTGTNFQGLGVGNPNQGGPAPVTDAFNNPMGPPPYQTVAFRNGFRFDNPFGSANFNIDPNTGFISVTPTRPGIFVFSISVFEWRNGTLLGENRRDFQIHVLECRPQGVPPTITSDLSNLNFSNDTIFVEAKEAFCYDIRVEDSDPMDNLQAYTVSAAFGNGAFFPPPATFSFSGVNPIQGQVCWQPSCTYGDQVIPLIVGARDIGDCPNISDVFDTVYVKISAPPNGPPEITPNYQGLQRDNDTLIVSAMSDFCYTFDIVDPNASDRINTFTTSDIFDDPNGPTFSVTGSNPVQGQVCWTPDCELEGEVVELSFSAADIGGCSRAGPVESKIYVKVVVPENAPPAIATDLGGNTFVEDTIFVDAMEAFCYTFNVTDPNIGDDVRATAVSPIFFETDGPQLVISDGGTPLEGQICWEPGCEYEDQLIELVINAQDQGMCDSIGQAFDTVYIKVSVPPNDPPQITTDLGGNTFRNDTIFVTANEGLCYTFNVTDPNAQDELQLVSSGDVFGDPNAPVVNFSGTNPITGEICWTPDCDYAGQVVPLSLIATDNGMCNNEQDALNTVYVAVQVPPNDAPTATHNLAGLNAVGDTVFVFAEEELCYDLIFQDANLGDSLLVEPLGVAFGSGATFTPLGVNPVQGQVCWTPGCEFEDQVVPLLVRARDNGECNNSLEVIDTVFVSIEKPVTLPPVVESDLSGTNHVGDTVTLFIGEGLCYDFFVADRTPTTELDYRFEFQDFGGTDIGLGTVDVQRRNDSIVGQVCFQSDCSNGGSLYRLIITGVDARTCPPFEETRDTVFVKVNTDFGSDAGPSLAFCEGTGGTRLSVSPIGGSGPYYYEWNCTQSPNCGFSNPNAANPIVNPTGTATYYVQITDRFGCTSEIDSVSIEVKAQPRVDVGPDLSICEEDGSVQLSVDVVNDSLSPGPYTFQWLPAEGLSDPTVANPTASPASTTIYTVLVQGANGCSSEATSLDTTSSVTVRVSERPKANAGEDLALCVGDSLNLAGFATGAGPNYTYEWFPATGLDDPASQSPRVSPAQTTTYVLTATSNGCVGIPDTVTVEVIPLPTVNPGTNYEICATDELRLDGRASGQGEAGFTYRWTPNVAINDPLAAEVVVSPDTTTTYTLVATSSTGCVSEPYEVRVDVLPTPRAMVGEDVFICRGDSVPLAGSHTFFGGVNPPGAPLYSWSPANELSDATAAMPLASPQETRLYTLTVTFGPCATTDEVKVDVFNTIQTAVTASATEVCEGDTVRLTAAGGSGGALFSWSPSATLNDPGSASPLATPTQATTYYVRIEEGGCEAVDSIEIAVNTAPSVEFVTSTDAGCASLQVGFIETTQLANVIAWDFGDGSPVTTQSMPVHTYEAPGTYEPRLTAFSEEGCSATFTGAPIVVSPKGVAGFTSDPPVDQAQVLPNVVINFFDQSANARSYSWNFGDGTTSTEQNPVHSYTEAGEYTVTLVIEDAGGCQDTVRQGIYPVFAPDLFIPNVFSPNNDGVNDAFLVRYTGKERFRMEIFDRWGKRMFEENGNAANGWNGQAPSGNPAGEGVYYYTVRIGGKSYTGNLTLVR